MVAPRAPKRPSRPPVAGGYLGYVQPPQPMFSSYFAKQAADKLAAGNTKPPAPGPKPPKPPKTKKPAGKAMTLPATTAAVAPAAPAAVGLPSGVLRALSQFDADRAALAVRARQSDIERRNIFSQGLIGAGQMAADIYGGRSPAIMGQAVTGVQRQALSSAVELAARRQAEEQALSRALGQTLDQQYGMASERALEEARRRGAMLSQIRAVGA
jgi:hypothetical protein